MIVLYTFGSAFGLPDPSPFVIKAEMLLKLAGVDYAVDTRGFGKAPKGKLPYLVDDGLTVADSTFIRLHIEKKYGFEFDSALNLEQKGLAWSIEKMLEDHLYWFVVQDRWMDDANFRKGPIKFFEVAPAVLRPMIIPIVRRKLRAALAAQGLGRHTPAERGELAQRAVAALANVLGEKRYLFGDRPCGADATFFAFVAAGLCPLFASATQVAMAAQPNLVAYRDRMLAQFYPGFKADS